VEGGFTTVLGKYQASWQLLGGGYTLSYNVPQETTGQIVLPCLTSGRFPSIAFDGRPVPAGMNPRIEGNAVALDAPGGSHQIVVS
jgi:hypothetical protein